MKKLALSLCGVLGLFVMSQATRADGPHSYWGEQPWWNLFAHRPKLNPEEAKLQHFWHDYYDSMGRYYQALEHIDWVTYYKNHGYQINTGGGPGCYSGCGSCGGPNRIQFAPVFVSPGMQWAVPNSSVNGPPNGPQNPPMSVYTSGGPPISYGPAYCPPPGPPYVPGGPMGGPPGGPMGGPMMGGMPGPGGPMMGGMPGPGGPMGGMPGPGGPMMGGMPGPGGPMGGMPGPGGPMMGGPMGGMPGPGGPMGPMSYNSNQFGNNFAGTPFVQYPPVQAGYYDNGWNGYRPDVVPAGYVTPAYDGRFDGNGYAWSPPPCRDPYGYSQVQPVGYDNRYDGSNFATQPSNCNFGGGCYSEGCGANQLCFGPYSGR